MAQELRQIGFKLTSGEVERKLVSRIVRPRRKADRSPQYPHYISHHLGSDLHDCPIVGRSNL